ncbi:CTAGE FAMILY PROTEIN-RELATED [Salix viminalis]|uniref:CTAGE FAMILY PROTEIN-RELATED n=1 Tax=Salix viminalis TaxID=40686 RepID=A0A9Q0NYD9_SALVM|nr:CTAGE FAMILY PROTEIN-RELATED [Salix viminalis]
MEEVKCIKETTEQELKGNELQLALNEASIQTLEARISIIQDEISSVGSQVEGLKMFDLNAKIRKFQEEKGLNSQEKSSIGTMAEPDRQAVKKVVTEVELRALEDILAHVASQTTKEEQEYMAEENIQNQVQKDILTFRGSFL